MAQASPAFERSGFADPALLLRWGEIAGLEVARVASPLRLQEGPNGATLTVASEPGAAVFLQHETRALISRINAFLGPKRITRIQLVPMRLEPKPEPAPHPLGLFQAPVDTEHASGLDEALERLGFLRSRPTQKSSCHD